MTNTFYFNALELSPSNNIYVTAAPSFDPGNSYESTTSWRGRTIRISDVQPKPTKVVLKGFCTTEAALRSIVKYDSQNYDWNTDSEALYLIKDLSRRWKIYSMQVTFDYDWNTYPFTAIIVLNKVGGEGYVQTSKTGTSSSSPISIASILNAGDQDTFFDFIKITGAYSGGANLTSPAITQSTIGYVLNVADIILDTAYFEFYNDYTAKHTYIDAFATTNGFTRNKNSSTNVTFDTDHLDIAASGTLQYRFRLLHPLLQDPVLTLTIPSMTGSPALEVSPDASNWWEAERTLTTGSREDYNLTKLAGYDDFYFRITTAAGEALSLSYMKLISWHNYSGQRPIPYIRPNSTSETMSISFSAGAVDYDLRYRDKWSV